jgi:hypothetical protein
MCPWVMYQMLLDNTHYGMNIYNNNNNNNNKQFGKANINPIVITTWHK